MECNFDIDSVTREREFSYTEKDFVFLSSLVKERAGINLSNAKKELVYGRLAKRLRSLGLNSFGQYCEYLEQGHEEELIHFINAITTNVTDFFREKHHFEFLSERWLPELIEKHSGRGRPRVRIWSAGCSTGEEPYSIAITLRESIPDIQKWDIKILATDLDSSVIEKARKGIYSTESVSKLSKKCRERWFRRGIGDSSASVLVDEDVKSMVSFKSLNLTQAWPMKGPFDVVFCRNVIIYFDRATREAVINRFAEMLELGGYFFIGHSESLFGATKKFKLVGRTIHRKTDL